jgi:hypothetical protein
VFDDNWFQIENPPCWKGETCSMCKRLWLAQGVSCFLLEERITPCSRLCSSGTASSVVLRNAKLQHLCMDVCYHQTLWISKLDLQIPSLQSSIDYKFINAAMNLLKLSQLSWIDCKHRHINDKIMV